ncbi:hypothetical protein F5I97DRAFT_1891488 [Phlebopus sp. FC_14]|nr:hypothetical protein F5I97DRAFT_1891488 [Phlebopus sp. FC_14]
MNPLELPRIPTSMLNSTDNAALSEPESLSDSDWLDISSTDREFDDNDSIFSSRETDHERLSSRSRSRQSSLSYGSSREGDVDAWEGLIEDSADEGMPDDVRASSSSALPTAFNGEHSVSPINPTDHTSIEELRVKEGLDQSMISTLSSSRSSSLHASTVQSFSRDLRLSFPDPITSSREELLNTSYEDLRLPSDTNPDNTLDVHDDEMLSASQILPVEQLTDVVSHPVEGEFKVFLYGFSSPSKWPLVHKLLDKVVDGAGLAFSNSLLNMEGHERRLFLTGHSESNILFPRVIVVVDKTIEQDIAGDLSPTLSADVPNLAVIYLPSCPPQMPRHTYYLPILASPSCCVDVLETNDSPRMFSAQETWDRFNVPDPQLLHLTEMGEPAVLDERAIDSLDSSRVHQAFCRIWSEAQRNVSKATLTTSHALTVIAILSLLLGIVIRSVLPTSNRTTLPTPVMTFSNCSSSSIWQLLKPVAYTPDEVRATTRETSVVSFREFAVSVFSAESTSVSFTRVSPTHFHRTPSSVISERLKFSKDVILRASPSVLAPDHRPKSLSIVRDINPTIPHPPGPASTARALSPLTQTSVFGVVKEYAPVVSAIVNQDMQDIIDALDALVQAISRQAQFIMTQTTALIQQSMTYLEKSMQSFDIKETFHMRHERARGRAKEIRDQGAKWLHGAGEALTSHTQSSKGVAVAMAKEVASRADQARGMAKQVAEELRGLVHETEGFEELRFRVWDMSSKEWRRWQKRAGKKASKSKRLIKQTIVY